MLQENLAEAMSYDEFVGHYGRDQCPVPKEAYLFLARELQLVPGNPEGLLRLTSQSDASYTGGPSGSGVQWGTAGPVIQRGAVGPINQWGTAAAVDSRGTVGPVDEQNAGRKRRRQNADDTRSASVSVSVEAGRGQPYPRGDSRGRSHVASRGRGGRSSREASEHPRIVDHVERILSVDVRNPVGLYRDRAAAFADLQPFYNVHQYWYEQCRLNGLTKSQLYRSSKLCSSSARPGECGARVCAHAHGFDFVAFVASAAVLRHGINLVRSRRGVILTQEELHLARNPANLSFCMRWAVRVESPPPYEGSRLEFQSCEARQYVDSQHAKPRCQGAHSVALLEEAMVVQLRQLPAAKITEQHRSALETFGIAADYVPVIEQGALSGAPVAPNLPTPSGAPVPPNLPTPPASLAIRQQPLFETPATYQPALSGAVQTENPAAQVESGQRDLGGENNTDVDASKDVNPHAAPADF
ncbi:MAG: hypothetical protein Q9159_005988 [Coniocarpon cinnabarinum]